MKTAGKVLITGGYGFIGSHVAERFQKEGYKIYIIDNLSSGKRSTISFKHEFYNMDIIDEKCEEVFRSNRFDVIIHLAAKAKGSGLDDSLNEYTKTNVLGLSNILALSTKYNVSKVIFASSGAVYGNPCNGPYDESMKMTPTSSLGISKEAGEEYCNYYRKRYDVQIVSLRISNVYGPRQPKEEGNLSTFIQKVYEKENLVIHDNGYQTKDYIYVEDVAFAIYQCAIQKCQGTFNLSTNTGHNLHDIFDYLIKVTPVNNVTYVDFKKSTSDNRLDNTLLQNTIHWQPKYSLEQGLRMTLAWHLAHDDKEEEIDYSDEEKNKTTHKILPYLENLMGFMVVAAFSYMKFLDTEIAYGYRLDLKMIYIILIGIVYGTKQVSISIVLSCLLQIGLYLGTGRDIISFFYNIDSIVHLSAYILIGLLIGYVIDRKNRDVTFTRDAYDQSVDDYSFLNQLYDRILVQKNKLESQIIGSNDSFAKIYETTSKLDSVEIEDIYAGSINVVEKIMKTNKVTLYVLDHTKKFMRLVAKSKNLGRGIPVSVNVSDYMEIQGVINNKGTYVNRQLKADVPLLISPVYDNGEVVAVMSIHDVKFEELTLYYENLFNVVIRLISSSLSRAYRYTEVTSHQRYKEYTKFLRGEAFVNLLKSKEKTKESFEISYVLLQVKTYADNMDTEYYKELSHKLSQGIRETDYLCMDDNNHVYILLSNINKDEAQPVMERFRSKDIDTTLVDMDKLINTHLYDADTLSKQISSKGMVG